MKICLQHNGESVCHHLNGSQRIHNLLQLVLPQNPVWGKPGTHTDVSHLNLLHLISLRWVSESYRRTLVLDGIYEALPEQRSFRWATRSSSAWRKFVLRPSDVYEQWGGKCCESSPKPWAGSSPPKTKGEVRLMFLNKLACFFRRTCAVQTRARCLSCRSRARRKQALVKMLPPFSATLSPAFSRYLCSRSSRISTEFSTKYTASVVLWYYWQETENGKLKLEIKQWILLKFFLFVSGNTDL